MRFLPRWSLPLVLLSLLACAEEFGPTDEPPDEAADGDAGLLPFLAACTTNEACASGLCFNFNAKGLHCTHACASAADCEAPSAGCSGMGVCKTP